MKFLLDFDDTLYNSVAFKDLVATDGKQDLLFTPEVWQHYDVRNFFFSDTLEWLRSKRKQDLYILTAFTRSYGSEAEMYQREKLRLSQMDALVTSVSFAEGDKGGKVAEIASQFPPDEPIVFVDDRIEQCLSVKAAVPRAICCLMARDPAIIGDVKEVQGIPVVHTLEEVDGIIKKL